MEPLLSVRNLSTRFFTHEGVVKAVEDVSFDLEPGETLGIVGESGCGKSVTALSIMRLIQSPPGKIVGGRILFDGDDLLEYDDEEIRKVRGNKITMIFQDPMTSLNPFLRIGRQLTEGLELHLKMSKHAAEERAVKLLDMVGIPSPRSRLDEYPHQFSGGMRQRVMIAMALSCQPRLLIADEPTTALDVTIQAQILDLIKNLKKETGTAVMLITHDLGVVAGMCQRIIVMYAGRIVESGNANDVFHNPCHPYTIGLLKSVPRLDEKRKEILVPIPGLPPDLIGDFAGCHFAERCDYAQEACWKRIPVLEMAGPGHEVACLIPMSERSVASNA